MTTYTIAFTKPAPDGSSLLLATVPDGADIRAAAEEWISDQRLGAVGPVEWETESGLTLTDEEPDNEDRIIWRGHDLGWLTDETGKTFDYAIRGTDP